MEKHIKILGIVHIVHSLLAVITGIMILGLLAAVGFFTGGADAAGILGIIGAGFAVLLLILAAPGLIGGTGLLMFKPWARILVLVLGFLSLLEVPFGTALGIYTVWVLLHDETREFFQSSPDPTESY